MKAVIAHVTKRLGGRAVVDDVSLTLEAPGTVALLGQNGAGKSTLLRVVAGVLAADVGTVHLDGLPIEESAARRRIGYVPESADPLPELTVDELLRLCGSLKEADLPPAATLSRLGIEPYRRQRIGSLSLGQRRRACLAAALVGAPPLLLLDEPTNGLDPDGVALLGDLLREHAAGGGLSLLATHDLAFARGVGGRVVRMAHGRLVDERYGDGAGAEAR